MRFNVAQLSVIVQILIAQSISPKLLPNSIFVRSDCRIPSIDFRESWKQASQRAGLPGLLFHDLRRTAVRNLRRAEVAETVIMKITGHRTRSVFEPYNITDETDTREAGRKAEEFLAREHEDLAQSTSHEKERLN